MLHFEAHLLYWNHHVANTEIFIPKKREDNQFMLDFFTNFMNFNEDVTAILYPVLVNSLLSDEFVFYDGIGKRITINN